MNNKFTILTYGLIISLTVALPFIGSESVLAQSADLNNDQIDYLAKNLHTPLHELSSKEMDAIDEKLDSITTKQWSRIVERNFEFQKKEVQPGKRFKDELDYINAQKELSLAFNNELIARPYLRDPEIFRTQQNDIIKKNEHLIQRLDDKARALNKPGATYEPQNRSILEVVFRVNTVNAIGCQWDTSFTVFTPLVSGPNTWRHDRPFHAGRVRNDWDDIICDYVLIYPVGRQWWSTDGYTLAGRSMIESWGGLHRNPNGNRAIVGFGSATLNGLHGAEAVRTAVLKRW